MASITGNEDQIKFWDGPGGDHWARYESVYNGSVANYMPDFMAAAAVTPTDVVLDIGCGNGETTRAAAQVAASGRVVGVDISAAMVANARTHAREAGLHNIEVLHGDAQNADLGQEVFDLAISRTGAMFFADPTAAFSNVASSLKRDGRLTLLAWQPFERNEWQYALADALAMGRALPRPEVSKPGPMGLADPDFTRDVLAHSGFHTVEVTGVEKPFSFGADAERAFEFISSLGFAKGALEPLNQADRETAIGRLRATITEHAQPDGVWFGSGAWLVTATRA